MSSLSQHPKTISKYQVSKVLGQGAMGVVYKGFDTIIERTVAIKVLHPYLLQNDDSDDFTMRFKQEAQAAARCLHPNLVTIFDFGTENDTSYIVMEYVEGAELRELIHNRQINSVVKSVKIALQILDGLDAAHNKGVIHRDIKPANIIILNDNRVKVSDFGVARIDTSDLTNAGFMVGTPNYMSPEGLRGEQVDRRSDIFSCALLLLEMITHTKPYAGSNTLELLEVLNQQSQIETSLLHGLENTIRKALEPEKSKRYQSAAEFRQALSLLIEQRHEEQDDQKTIITAANKHPLETNHSNTAPPVMWNPDLLQIIENSLVQYVGPVAKLLIKKGSKTTSGVFELSQQLATQIPSENDRSQFLQKLNQSGIYELSLSGLQQPEAMSSITPSSHPSQVASGTPITPEFMEFVSKRLVIHTGPIASRIVKKEAKTSPNTQALIEKVSTHIPDNNERNRFIQSFRNKS